MRVWHQSCFYLSMTDTAKRQILADLIEKIIFRRVFEDRIVGYTIEMSQEIADAVVRVEAAWQTQ